MGDIGTIPARPLRRHLLSPETLARAVATSGEADLTRRHGQGNGIRINGIYFAAVASAAFGLVLAAITLASTMM